MKLEINKERKFLPTSSPSEMLDTSSTTFVTKVELSTGIVGSNKTMKDRSIVFKNLSHIKPIA